jgi:hypothetical protein
MSYHLETSWVKSPLVEVVVETRTVYKITVAEKRVIQERGWLNRNYPIEFLREQYTLSLKEAEDICEAIWVEAGDAPETTQSLRELLRQKFHKEAT